MRPTPPNLRVLVVDDDRDSADGLADLLELFGHVPTTALNGRDAVALAHELAPDVVLCDLSLPGLDGFGVARALRADPRTSGCRLVAVSGHAMAEIGAELTASGFDLHLAKPVNIDALEAVLLGQPPLPDRPRARAI